MLQQEKRKILYYVCLYLCVLLACLVPRYIGTFKIWVGVYISLFSVMTLFTWLVIIRRLRFYKSINTWFFPVWFIFVAASGWRAIQYGAWTYYVVWLLTAVLFQQILFFNGSRKTFDVIVLALCSALFLHLAMGIYEITTHTYLFPIGEMRRRLYGHVAISIFRNLNDYATFVATMFPFAIYKYFGQRSLPKKAFYAALAIVSFFLILRSECRGAIIALVLLAVILIILYYKKARKYQIIIIVGVLAAALLIVLLPSVQRWIVRVFQRNSIDVEDASDKVRINLLKNGLYFLKRTYGFGVGAGNLHYWLDNNTMYNIGYIRFMHNWYMEVLATFGIPFFVLYMILHVKNLVGLFASYDKEDRFWNLNNTILVSFASFSIVCVSSSSNIYSEWVWMYLVFVSTYCFMYCKRMKRRSSVREVRSLQLQRGLGS